MTELLKAQNQRLQKAKLSEFEKRGGQRARHRALIMQILKDKPGLTTQQIISEESKRYGFKFLTDNRLRELRKMGWVESREEHHLIRWYRTIPSFIKAVSK